MPTLHIHLLGEFRLTWGDAPISTINAPRQQALLAYLLLHRDAPQPRHHLAFLLWPDTTDAQALTNLRQLLHGLKQALPEADHFVHADAKTIGWRSDALFRLDVAEFEEALVRAAEQQGDPHALRVALEQAIALYHGDLLPSCYDDWILAERERLRQAETGALERLLLLLESEGQPRAALAYAQRLLRHDPLREDTYRALMRLYAACGDRAGVLRVYHTCASVLERELATVPSAATREAYEHALSVEVQTQSVLPPQPSTTNLPVQLTSFVGRTRALAELARLLSSTHLLTLTGPGGTGKTRLALEVAMTLLGEYPHGVWLVELAPLADPTLVAQTVALTLGVREQPGRTILDALLDYVRAKHLLLLLDNCEHLIEACAHLAETLLRAAPRLKIVASSREALGIAGETAYRVPSLPLPDMQAASLDALSQNDCVRLFVDRALAASPHFRLKEKNAPAIAQICQRLDGIPLAIELAAARTRVFPAEQIAARLSDRFRLLTGGSRTALERHQTLSALIDWSYDLLSEPERALLRRLSIFAGGWSFEAAQVVCGEGLRDDVLDLLTHLVDKSLVAVEEEAEEGRYHLLETIRQYARDKLFESGEAELVRDRHLEFFLHFAEEAEPKLRSAEQLAWLTRVESEYDNLRTALAWSLESSKSDRTLRLAGALSYFWVLRGVFSESYKWLNDALTFAEREQQEKSAALNSPPTPVEMAQRAKALYGATWSQFGTLDMKKGRMLVDESLRVWRVLGDTWWTAVALELKALLLSVGPDFEMAFACLEEGVALGRQIEDPWPLAVCLIRMGDALKPGGQAALARPFLEEGVALARRIGDKSVLSEGVRELGSVYYVAGDLMAAESLTEEALTNGRAIGSLLSVFLALFQLVVIACLQNDAGKAKRYCLEAWALGKDTGSPFVAMFAIVIFGLAVSASGEAGRGVRMLAAAQALLAQFGFKPGQGEPAMMVVRQVLEKAQAQLGPEAFQVAWTEGQQMTLEQALALATENASEDAPLPGSGLGASSEEPPASSSSH
jgi:predicted ATPase/DNA-binding SARP family transcriptional activator